MKKIKRIKEWNGDTFQNETFSAAAAAAAWVDPFECVEKNHPINSGFFFSDFSFFFLHRPRFVGFLDLPVSFTSSPKGSVFYNNVDKKRVALLAAWLAGWFFGDREESEKKKRTIKIMTSTR